jgi:pimeloyl-ACP methyl ester carboxylesterase
MATSVQPKEKSVNVNGINLHYLDWGAEGKPKVLLLHGLRGHRHSWDDVSAEFYQNYHIFALDQRGRGESDWAPGGDYSSESFVADLEGFCAAVGLDKFILIGHSMGGRNSMAFAGENADKIEKMVIIDIGPDLNPIGSGRITQEMIDVPEEFDSFEAVFEYQRKQNRFCSEPVLRRRLTYATRELPNGKFGWRYDLEIREQRRNSTGAKQPDLWLTLPKINCPVLIVRGSETDTLGLETAEKMVEVLPDGKLVHVERAAHMVFEDNPEGFISVLHDFLD